MWTIAKIYLDVLYAKAKGPVMIGALFTLKALWLPIIISQNEVFIQMRKDVFFLYVLTFIMGIIVSLIISHVIEMLLIDVYNQAERFWRSVKTEADRIKREKIEAKIAAYERTQTDTILQREVNRYENNQAELARELGPTPAEQAREILQQRREASRHIGEYEGPSSYGITLTQRLVRDNAVGTPIVTELPEAEPEITGRPNRLESINES